MNAAPVAPVAVEDLQCAYMPVWEVKRGALTTYVCLARGNQTEASLYEAHKTLFAGQAAEEKLRMDIGVLNYVIDELKDMEAAGRKLFVVCPVQLETLHNFKNYERYKAACDAIPLSCRPFLIFLVMMDEQMRLPTKETYWFAAPLKQYCCQVFSELLMRKDMNFQYIKHAGIDAVGVRFHKTSGSEQDAINMLTAFDSRAKYFKIRKSFVFGVETLSATTSLICAGFDYLGGGAIHDDVAHPDTVHRYRYEDLVSELLPADKTDIPDQG